MARITVGIFLFLAIIVTVVLVKRTSSTDSKVITLFNWSDYMDPSVLEDFKKEFGVTVIEQYFDANEVVRAKLLAGAKGYDVIVPSEYMIETMIKDQLLAPLDQSKIDNLKHISKHFLNLAYDPDNNYSVPYMFSTTGIGYRKDLVTKAPESWSDLFNPEFLAAMKGRISMLLSPREAIGAALQALGYSINSTNEDEIQAAVKLLKTQKSFLARYDAESFGQFLVSGDLVVAQGWSGTFVHEREKNSEISYVLPKEGGIIGVDCFVIPKNSENQELAHQFINFILRPEINARIVNLVHYPTANESAKEFIKPEIVDDPILYPSDEQIQKAERLRDVGEHIKLYEAAWKELMVTH